MQIGGVFRQRRFALVQDPLEDKLLLDVRDEAQR
jgi:hypothetical protein